MKSKLILLILIGMLISCSTSQKTNDGKPLYEVLYQDAYAGASIQFYEIVTESKEYKMLLNDDKLKKKITANDITTSNFLILNLGERNSGGYAIAVDSIEETSESIIVTVKEVTPKPGEPVTLAMTYPMCIVKINSKKEVIFK